MEGTLHASNILSDGPIPYWPKITTLTGRVTASILLQQMLYFWRISGYRPFYKFRAPCKHDRYREDDSWTECLGFSPAEFDTALKTIATKITKGTSRSDALAVKDISSLVIYWTDSDRVTWYEVNVDLVNELVDPLFSNANSRKCNYPIDEDSANIIELENPELHSSYRPENTQRDVPPPSEPERPKPTIAQTLRRCMTTGEDEQPISQLAEYIGQQFHSPVPAGQRTKLAMDYTEQLLGGKVRKHPSPDKLWIDDPLFTKYVDERIGWIKGNAGGSVARQRAQAVNAICQYKGGYYAWLEWKERQGPVPEEIPGTVVMGGRRLKLVDELPINEGWREAGG